jgi:hypothetical protein
MAANLPKSVLIAYALKTADMISISSRGICGEDDFRCARLKKARLPAGTAGVFQAKKYRYGVDMGGFWFRDKCRIIADSHKNT